MRLLVSGGGTGGHVYPVLAVVAEIQKIESARSEIVYLGRHGGIEERLAERAKIPFAPIQVGGIRGLSPWTAVGNLYRLLVSIQSVRSLIRRWKPEAIFATGGYVSAPVIWGSAAERVPSVIYLPDLEPGWSVRATASWATCIAISFPEVAHHLPKNKSRVTGYPVRSDFFGVDRTRARTRFQLNPQERTVTVFGGSRGAHAINQAVIGKLRELVTLAQLILIAGREDEAWVKSQVQGLAPDLAARLRVFGYLDEELPDALAAADIVVARAGAATLGEFPALGLPAVLVPYPYAGKHQDRNADFLASRGAAVCVRNASLEQDLAPTLQRLLSDSEQLNKMARAARALAVPDAANRIARLVQSLAGACA